MQIEKKLIACSILAIAIGIATVVPLAFFMNAKAQTLEEPWFNVNIPYAYFKLNSSSYQFHLNSAIALNVTVNSDNVNENADARVEYYQCQIYTDQNQISNVTYFFATNSPNLEDPIAAFQFNRLNWFNSTAGGGYYVTNLTAPIPLMRTGNSMNVFVVNGWEDSEFGNVIRDIENSDAIYVDLHRLGYVTFDANNTIVTLSDNQLIQHLELTRKGDAFTYGEPPTADMLTQGEQPYPTPQP